MKNSAKLFGFIALAVVIGFSMAACGDGGSLGGGEGLATYLSYDEDGNEYKLEIKEYERAAYSPKGGDNYVLTITAPDGRVLAKSTGTVTSINESNIELKHSSGATITITVTVSSDGDNAIAEIKTGNGNIPSDSGFAETVSAPELIRPNKFEIDPVTGLLFEFINNGRAYSVRKGKVAPTGTLNIPASYKNLPVTEIGQGAFFSFGTTSSLTSVILPQGLTSIGVGAFGFTSLSTITIPSSVTSIGAWAFECTKLTSVIIPSGITIIEDGVFAHTDLTGVVTIPEGVTSIGEYAFECTKLTSITIPSRVKFVGLGAFSDWTSSQTINIRGYASLEEANAAWGTEWLNWSNNATLKFWNGSSYQ